MAKGTKRKKIAAGGSWALFRVTGGKQDEIVLKLYCGDKMDQFIKLEGENMKEEYKNEQ